MAAPAIDDNDIGGVVTGRLGPEAGVWVVAETTELGTRFAKMAVTDDFGRFVVPDLPKATYRVWVRGYGLVDSPKVTAEPGKTLDLTAVTAPTPQAAAQYYPAIYWASMIRVPDKSMFPGTGPNGNGIPLAYKSQDLWINTVKTNGCGNCHQIGNYATRNFPAALGTFDSSIAAWARRLQSGPAGRDMSRFMATLMTPDGGHLKALADWTDRIKAGEIPAAMPPRPVGVERNLVVTVRDWSDPKHYLHDLTLTDRRKPTVNGYGLIYGAAELSTDNLPVLDPVKNTKTTMKVPVAGSEICAEFGARQPDQCAVGVFRHGADLGHPGQRPQSHDGPGRPGLLHGANPLARRTRRTIARRIRRCARRNFIRSPDRKTVSCRTPVRSRCGIRTPRSSTTSIPASAPIT